MKRRLTSEGIDTLGQPAQDLLPQGNEIPQVGGFTGRHDLAPASRGGPHFEIGMLMYGKEPTFREMGWASAKSGR